MPPPRTSGPHRRPAATRRASASTIETVQALLSSPRQDERWIQANPADGLDDELDLLADALRRAVDLRDALAEAGESKASGATRAVKLIQILNTAWSKALHRRLGSAIHDDEIVHTRPWELLERLRNDGRLPGHPEAGDGSG